jgi:hypothetical protein
MRTSDAGSRPHVEPAEHRGVLHELGRLYPAGRRFRLAPERVADDCRHERGGEPERRQQGLEAEDERDAPKEHRRTAGETGSIDGVRTGAGRRSGAESTVDQLHTSAELGWSFAAIQLRVQAKPAAGSKRS